MKKFNVGDIVHFFEYDSNEFCLKIGVVSGIDYRNNCGANSFENLCDLQGFVRRFHVNEIILDKKFNLFYLKEDLIELKPESLFRTKEEMISNLKEKLNNAKVDYE